ncbi:MAG: DUF3883 domain-containing protein [Flavobacterium sp.]|uniref:DUF3883 domain-containing protein n=1 Tax=Flavobacterium sp. TaxID=239 RepID=UPI003BDA0616
MLNDLRTYDNLGDPHYFFELFSSLKNDEAGVWTVRDAEQLFYNKNINGRTIFDGCLVLALKISIVELDELEKISINHRFKDFLLSENQMCDKFVEFLFQALHQDEIFHTIFSLEHISYDIIYHTTQINNSAFGFKYSNFKQLLIDFNVIQIHPTKELSKYILNSRYKKIFDKIILPEIKKRKIGIDELKKSMEQQQIHGEEAEIFVLNFERERLENKVGIDWVAEYSIAEGYDISSFQQVESEYNDCFIEVKSYSGTPYFFWSRNEVDISRIKGDHYFLYLVDRNQMSNDGYKPIIIQNPFKEVLHNDKWIKQIEKYKIQLK